MKIKLLSALLISACAVCCAAGFTACHDQSENASLKYTLSKDSTYYTVSSIGDCTDTDIVIPSTYNNLPVIAISEGAFYNCSSLTNITIPDSVIYIDNYAFTGCSSLTSITIPDSVTSIGNSAFSYCSSLSSVSIPDSVTSIGENVFSNCISLTSVTIPDSVTSIGYYAFYNCTSLTSVTIPDGVTSIGSFAFDGCSSLTAVYITDIAAWCGISFSDLTSNPLYYAQNLYLNGELVTDLVIPDGVTSIGYSAFYNCSSLTSVTIGSGVTYIGDCVFESCSSLTNITVDEKNSYFKSIDGNLYNKDGIIFIQYAIGKSDTSFTIPDSVVFLGNSAFHGCSSLINITVDENNNCYKSIDGNLYDINGTTLIQYAIGKTDTSFTIPDGVTSIGNYAFESCTSLTNVTIPDGVTSIGEGAFYKCTSMTSVTIPDSVTSIGEGAFYKCTSLTSVTIGSGVTSIGDMAFYNCFNLTEINFNATACAILNEGNEIFHGAGQSGNGIKVTIGANVTEIPDYLFYDYYDSSSSPKIVTVEFTEGSVCESIGYYAFYGCTSLTSITIPDSVTLIGYYAFYGCTSLTSITIPDSVTSIYDWAFYNCTSLSSVTFLNTDGWFYTSSFSTTDGISIPSTSLANPTTAAEYLTITYSQNHWYRT